VLAFAESLELSELDVKVAFVLVVVPEIDADGVVLLSALLLFASAAFCA
jgi:hypothetical protein